MSKIFKYPIPSIPGPFEPAGGGLLRSGWRTTWDVRGFVCLAPAFEDEDGRSVVLSGWAEHSVGCEMFEPSQGGES